MSLEQKYGTATKFITMAPKVSRGISTVKPIPSRVYGASGTHFFTSILQAQTVRLKVAKSGPDASLRGQCLGWALTSALPVHVAPLTDLGRGTLHEHSRCRSTHRPVKHISHMHFWKSSIDILVSGWSARLCLVSGDSSFLWLHHLLWHGITFVLLTLYAHMSNL